MLFAEIFFIFYTRTNFFHSFNNTGTQNKCSIFWVQYILSKVILLPVLYVWYKQFDLFCLLITNLLSTLLYHFSIFNKSSEKWRVLESSMISWRLKGDEAIIQRFAEDWKVIMQFWLQNRDQWAKYCIYRTQYMSFLQPWTN